MVQKAFQRKELLFENWVNQLKGDTNEKDTGVFISRARSMAGPPERLESGTTVCVCVCEREKERSDVAFL